MTSRVPATGTASAVPAFDLVIFGGTGDLARRKLLPALLARFRSGQIPPGARIIGAARAELSCDAYRIWIRESLPSQPDVAENLDRFLGMVNFVRIDLGGTEGWSDLISLLARSEAHVQVFYLAVGPALIEKACRRLREALLNGPTSRVVIEKPIGHDLASAREISVAMAACFEEQQIYRIDHYLGKETVQNLLALRFGNALFEPLWNSGHIDHLQITVAERLGLEGRTAYYDAAGALRDMVQNHLLQLLCFVAMEPPTLGADSVRDEKLKVLRSLRPLGEREVRRCSVRGQYRAGVAGCEAVPGYLQEVGRPDSGTETFVALRAEINNWRWAGVPFFLRTGKRLAERVSEIVVTFRPTTYSIFGNQAGPLMPNRLVIRLQPDDGVQLAVMIKEPGPGPLRLRSTSLDLSFAEEFAGRSHPDAYERLLMDVVRGDQTLFMRRDEVEAAWHWVDPILAAWARQAEAPRPYPAGSWGPSAAIALIEREGRTWYEDRGLQRESILSNA
jgi:glucose-6-phosphate 1-dehydrogenase